MVTMSATAIITTTFNLVFCHNMLDMDEVEKCLVNQGHTGYEIVGHTYDHNTNERMFIAFKPDNNWVNIRPTPRGSRYGNGGE